MWRPTRGVGGGGGGQPGEGYGYYGGSQYYYGRGRGARRPSNGASGGFRAPGPSGLEEGGRAGGGGAGGGGESFDTGAWMWGLGWIELLFVVIL